jgi:dihydropteroate synthase
MVRTSIAALALGSRKISFDRTVIMGVLNVTPDSFSDGGLFNDPQKALERAKIMVAEGCDILDVGGESTRPFSSPAPANEELGRVLPVIELIRDLDVPISIDTNKPEVAAKALEMGADMVNDITGLRNESMVKLVAEKKVPVVVMHMRGEPSNMQEDPVYDDVVVEVMEYLRASAAKAEKAGIGSEQIIVDPGIGFGKTTEHNLEVLKRLDEFRSLGYPILVGVSRKSFIEKILGNEAGDRLEGSLAAMAAAIMNGANIVRVHDVKESVRVAGVLDALMSA